MKCYILTGLILLSMSVACEDRKRGSKKKPSQTVLTTEVTSSPEITLPTITERPSPPSDVESPSVSDTSSSPPPKMKLSAKSAPMRFEDVTERLLEEGQANEEKDEGLQKIRQKAYERARLREEMEEKVLAANQKIPADEPASSPVESSPPSEASDGTPAPYEIDLPEIDHSTREMRKAAEDAARLAEASGKKMAMIEPSPMHDDEATQPSPVENAESEALAEPAVELKSNVSKKAKRNLDIQFERAVAKSRVGRKEEAKNEFLQICQSGHAHACHKFAWYEETSGNGKNASRFYQAACDHGLGKACNNLAFQFERKKDFGRALELYAKGCTEKHVASCNSLKRVREEQRLEGLKAR